MTSARAGWRQWATALVFSGQWVTAPLVFALEPAHIKAGPFYVAPTLAGELLYTDNLLRDSDSTVDTWATLVKPRVQTWLQDGFNTYSLSYELIDTKYFDSSDDDATDHRFDLDVHREFNAKNTLDLSAKYYKLHEERGTGLSEGDGVFAVDEPVKFDLQRLGGRYQLGNQQSTGSLELETRWEELEYRNFRQFTVFRDRQSSYLRGTFYYKAGARSRALLELKRVEQNYDTDFVDPAAGVTILDSTEHVALAGMTWAATAKTSGSIKVGGFQRNYRDSSQSNDDGFHWEAEVTWRPRTYSSLLFKTRRLSEETNSDGNYVEVAEYRSEWNHTWGARSRSIIYLGYDEEDYTGSARNDELTRFGASIDYSLRRWLDLELGYRFEKRSSSENTLSFERNTFFVSFRLSL